MENFSQIDVVFSPRPVPWRTFLSYVLLLGLTVVLYGTVLHFDFVWDDVDYVLGNSQIKSLSPTRLWAIWRHPAFIHGHYAPVNHTFLAFLHSISATNPFGYHFGQLLIHAACVVLLYRIIQRIESTQVALIAALLFVVHPANIETVAWISETKSTLAFLFFMLSFWYFLRVRESEKIRYLIFCGAFFVLSVLAKINTIVAPAIFLLYDYWQTGTFWRKKILHLVWLFAISAAFVCVHLMVSNASAGAPESVYYGGMGVHLLNLPLLVLFYVRMALLPIHLSAWHMFRVHDRFDLVLAEAWTALLAFAWILYRSNRRIQFWGLWFLVFLSPVLQIIPFPIWVADRYLYIPAIGLFILESRFFFRTRERLATLVQRRGLEFAGCALLLAYAWQTYAHLPVWRNNLALWGATVKTCETSPYCHSNYGSALLEVGQTERGMQEMIRSVEIRPAPRYLIHLGDAYTLNTGDYRQAVIAYGMALQNGATNPAEVYARLARTYILSGQFDNASSALQMGARIKPGDPLLLVVSSFLEWKRGNSALAHRVLEQARSAFDESSALPSFVYSYWGNTGEVDRFIADVGSLPGKDSLKAPYPSEK